MAEEKRKELQLRIQKDNRIVVEDPQLRLPPKFVDIKDAEKQLIERLKADTSADNNKK